MMLPTHLDQILPQLRDAVGPVILISGVGLLLLTMTNRLGRAIDRSRQLKQELATRTGHEQEQTQAQVKILYRRAKIIRRSIILAAGSASLAAILIITLFLASWFQMEVAWLIGLIFIGCMVSLLCSLIAFMVDVNLALAALKMELEPVLKQER